jgi:hypothetical protein
MATRIRVASNFTTPAFARSKGRSSIGQVALVSSISARPSTRQRECSKNLDAAR